MSGDGDAASPRVLVVDDTPANIQMLAGTLQAEGYAVSVATRGAQALELMERVRPDLVLLDVVMPEMDGFETCRRIKEVEAWRQLPVIFLTARTDTTDLVRGFELGAVDYVAKPFNAHELLARVRTHLTMGELRRTLAERNAELGRAHELVRRAFGRYVSEEVARSLLESPEALELGGEERELTILMSDLRGFTAMADRLPPQEVIECLNLYLETMVEVVGRWDGTIDEIIGDALLVIFGAPVAVEDHAEKAVACALSMQLAMEDVNRRLTEGGRPSLEMGIGVHSGRAVVGNIGSERRTKYAVVGSTVNLVGRIESFTTGGQILVSEQTRSRVTAPLRIDGRVVVEPKGASESVELHDVGGMGAPFDLSLERPPRELHALAEPIPVRFTVLEEKFVGRTVHDGTLTAISELDASFASDDAVAPLSNLRITVEATGAGNPAGEVYAKATEASDDGGMRLRFTSVSPDLERWIRETIPA